MILSNANYILLILCTSTKLCHTKAIQCDSRACTGMKYEGIMGDVTYETYQRNIYSQIVERGINVEQQVTKPNAEI